jgi:hypothetical protein
VVHVLGVSYALGQRDMGELRSSLLMKVVRGSEVPSGSKSSANIHPPLRGNLAALGITDTPYNLRIVITLKLTYVGVALRARMYDLNHEANRSPGDCNDFTPPALQRNPATAETR